MSEREDMLGVESRIIREDLLKAFYLEDIIRGASVEEAKAAATERLLAGQQSMVDSNEASSGEPSASQEQAPPPDS